MELSIILPLWNETARLPAACSAILGYLSERRSLRTEILLVDNGSTDGTRDLCCQLMYEHPGLIRALNIPIKGKGAAVQYGMLEARGEWRYMADVDLSTPIHELDKFLDLRMTGADVLIGDREDKRYSRRIGEPRQRHAMGRVFNWMVQSILLPGIQDSQCGFKLFRAAAADELFSRQTITGWAFDVEILYLARKLGYRLEPVPVTWVHNGDSRVNPLIDSIAMLREILKIRSIHGGLVTEKRIPEPIEKSVTTGDRIELARRSI